MFPKTDRQINEFEFRIWNHKLKANFKNHNRDHNMNFLKSSLPLTTWYPKNTQKENIRKQSMNNYTRSILRKRQEKCMWNQHSRNWLKVFRDFMEIIAP